MTHFMLVLTLSDMSLNFSFEHLEHLEHFRTLQILGHTSQKYDMKNTFLPNLSNVFLKIIDFDVVSCTTTHFPFIISLYVLK